MARHPPGRQHRPNELGRGRHPRRRRPAAAALRAVVAAEELRIEVESGTVALVLQRGVATQTGAGAGLYFVRPYARRTMQIYPLRELTLPRRGRPAARVARPAGRPAASCTSAIARPPRSTTPSASASGRRSCSDLHERIGPEGIRGVVRDRSRQVLLDRLGDAGTTYADLFGERARGPAGVARGAARRGPGARLPGARPVHPARGRPRRDRRDGAGGRARPGGARARGGRGGGPPGARAQRERDQRAARRRARRRGHPLPPDRAVARVRAALGRPRRCCRASRAARSGAAGRLPRPPEAEGEPPEPAP